MKRVTFFVFFLGLWCLSCSLSPKVGTSSKDPKAKEAEQFVAQVEQTLKKLWTARDRAAWINQNFITDDTEAMAALHEEATSAFMTQAINESYAFRNVALADEIARKLHLLRISQIIPAPSDARAREELATISLEMLSSYGKATYCNQQGCRNLDQLSHVVRTSRDYETLLDAWVGWHNLARSMRDHYARYVELANRGAQEIGFADVGALWRSSYDMPASAFEADVERLWKDVKPLYELLHCYVRTKLQRQYGKAKVPDHSPIPAHLLGNMWAQDWSGIYDLVEPYKNQPSLSIDQKLRAMKNPAHDMVKLGEQFFTSLGFEPLPKTFWQRSLFTRPRDRDVLCHATAMDVTWNNDLRIKMCIKPTEEDLIVIHHELGHLFYFQSYYQLPMLFQASANDGFHEGIGDAIALSVTPNYLQKLGLLDKISLEDKSLINYQLKMALDKVAFLPFGLLIDKWRWDVFSNEVNKDQYNEAFWNLRTRYQGVSAPQPRLEQDFDPGAKFHIPGSTPYIRYFLARIYQFQFHQALCAHAGHTGPLHTCSIYQSKAAGEKLRAMLSLGARVPWPEALFVLSGERTASAKPLLDYFAPLTAWLKQQTKNERCGW